MNSKSQIFNNVEVGAKTVPVACAEPVGVMSLRPNSVPAKPGRVRLPVFKGRGGLVAGVNPLSNKALLDALDDDD